MGGLEAGALLRLGGIGPGVSVIDAGCGSGWFSRRFAAAGARVAGVDRDPAMLAYARTRGGEVEYLLGDMVALPLPDKSFDVVTAVTSLCFVADETRALAEMARVARRRIVLGLLHRPSLLYLRKHGRGAHAGARWHARDDVERLAAGIPGVRKMEMETLLFWPGGPRLGRALESLPGLRYFGGFMAVGIEL
jgi:SAM-dependent methyltransferase